MPQVQNQIITHFARQTAPKIFGGNLAAGTQNASLLKAFSPSSFVDKKGKNWSLLDTATLCIFAEQWTVSSSKYTRDYSVHQQWSLFPMPFWALCGKISKNRKQKVLQKRANNTVPLAGGDITPCPFYNRSEAGEVANKTTIWSPWKQATLQALYNLQRYNTAEMKLEKFMCFSRFRDERNPGDDPRGGIVFFSSPSPLPAAAVAVTEENAPCWQTFPAKPKHENLHELPVIYLMVLPEKTVIIS